jgi:hypothetical protein
MADPTKVNLSEFRLKPAYQQPSARSINIDTVAVGVAFNKPIVSEPNNVNLVGYQRTSAARFGNHCAPFMLRELRGGVHRNGSHYCIPDDVLVDSGFARPFGDINFFGYTIFHSASLPKNIKGEPTKKPKHE